MSVLKKLAKDSGTSEANIRNEIQQALDEAWCSEDPAAREWQMKLFPEGKPSPEEAIILLTKFVLTTRDC